MSELVYSYLPVRLSGMTNRNFLLGNGYFSKSEYIASSKYTFPFVLSDFLQQSTGSIFIRPFPVSISKKKLGSLKNSNIAFWASSPDLSEFSLLLKTEWEQAIGNKLRQFHSANLEAFDLLYLGEFCFSIKLNISRDIEHSAVLFLRGDNTTQGGKHLAWRKGGLSMTKLCYFLSRQSLFHFLPRKTAKYD